MDAALPALRIDQESAAPPGDPDPPAAVDDLARRAHQFEWRLFRGLLVARAGFSAATCTVVVSAAITGSFERWSAFVWAILAVWTIGTTPFLWERLDWLRQLPAIAWLEITAFIALVFFGIDTRQWHLLHSFVPLVFTGFFTPAKYVRIVAGSLVAGLWGSYVVGHAWPGFPIESPERALVPSMVVVVGAVILVYVRRVMLDVELLVAAQRRAAGSVGRARRLLATASVRLETYELVAADLSGLAGCLSEAAQALTGRVSAQAVPHLAALNACVADIDLAVDELGTPRLSDTAMEPSSVLAELRSAIDRTTSLGAAVELRGPERDRPIPGPVVEVFRRLLTETVANARVHGAGRVTVTVSETSHLVIEVANEATGAVQPRVGGRGLHVMEDDATLLGGAVEWLERDGQIVARLKLPVPTASVEIEAADLGSRSLHASISRRRSSFETAVLISRTVLAIVTAVSIQVYSDKHRTLLPALTVASVFVVVWNGALLVFHTRVTRALARTPALILVDSISVVLLIAFLGGMGSPWMPVALGPVLMAGLYLGTRRAAVIVTLLTLAMAGGYGLVLAAGWNDQGTSDQSMPFGLVQNAFTFAIMAGIGIGVGWVFARIDDAADAYDRTGRLQFAAVREAAAADARAETGRQLHNSIEQYVKAALLRVGLIERTDPRSASLAAVELELAKLRDALESWATRLRAQ